MNTRRLRGTPGRTPTAKRLTSSWASLFGEGRVKKAWTCTFCGVNGSHRRGCHYVTRSHHRDRKAVRRGIVGARRRAAWRTAAGDEA
ncbi:MAG: hypothetical protein ACRDF9_14145 [Candidatus Limnocylindria bacterium]